MNVLIIKYRDSEGKVTERRISEIAVEITGAITAFCHLRQEKRTFNIKRILSAIDPESDEKIDDLYKYFGLQSLYKTDQITNVIDHSNLVEIPGHSSETYKGQRSKEKYDLFNKRFRYPVISNLFRNKLLKLFEQKCFKCGRRKNLDIDHHIPMVLGGHLVQGNLVALCKSCNGRKHDKHPNNFYTEEELIKLKPIFAKQNELFEFKFDWDKWHSNPKEYLLYLGVDPISIDEIFTNPKHPYFIELKSDFVGLTFHVDITNILNAK